MKRTITTLFITLTITSCGGSNEISGVSDSSSASGTALLISGSDCNTFDSLDSDIDCLDLSDLASVKGSATNGAGEVSFNDRNIALDGAVVERLDNDEYDNHASIELFLHDGEIRSLEKIQVDSDGNEIGYTRVWAITNGSFALTANLGATDMSDIPTGDFDFLSIDSDDVSVAGQHILFDALVDYDSNSDGRISSDDQSILVTAGGISIQGQKPNLLIDINLSLENGELITGQYTGDYFTLQNPRTE